MRLDKIFTDICSSNDDLVFGTTEDESCESNTGVFKNMVFGISDETGEYRVKDRLIKPIPYKKYIHKLKRLIIQEPTIFKEKPYKKFAYITSRVYKGAVRALDKYVMILDCDGKTDYTNAINWLNNKHIKFVSVQSSPGKYWVVCDIIDRLDKIINIMEKIPGVDTKYTECSKIQNVLLLRAFPKAGVLPKFDSVENLKGTSEYKRWVLGFKRYWESNDMIEMAGNLFVGAI